ncbi:MAG: hypothetical protein ABUL62_18710 [Myxococcales bacterium]
MSRFAAPLLIAWLATTTLHGAPLAASIAVERDATAGACPDRAALTRGVERILQRRLESNDAPDADLLRVSVWHAQCLRFFIELGGAEQTLWTLSDAAHIPQRPVAFLYNLWHSDAHWYPDSSSAAFPRRTCCCTSTGSSTTPNRAVT